MGRDQDGGSHVVWFGLFQSTRPSWGATKPRARLRLCHSISIHAPLVGRDSKVAVPLLSDDDFNPRAPRGARPSMAILPTSLMSFQSTRPSWGATTGDSPGAYTKTFQSTRPSWGATQFPLPARRRHSISIHAPLVGRDRCRRTATASSKPFQSTRPSWGATRSAASKSSHLDISIHAPLVGRDQRRSIGRSKPMNFNPRAPRGARRDHGCALSHGADFNPRAPRGARRVGLAGEIDAPVFQSTRPSWGATQRDRRLCAVLGISIHAPLVGRDTPNSGIYRHFSNFNPRARVGRDA